MCPLILANRTPHRYDLVMTVYQSLRPLYLRWEIDLPAANGHVGL